MAGRMKYSCQPNFAHTKLMKTCLKCGNDYEYNPNKPLGASSSHCSGCRKKNTALNKRIYLFELAAGSSNTRCLKCGYDKPYALKLIDAVNRIDKPISEAEIIAATKTQFLLCLNCEAEINSGDFEMKVIDSKRKPTIVEFYYSKITIVKEKIQTEQFHETDQFDITTDEPRITRALREPIAIGSCESNP